MYFGAKTEGNTLFESFEGVITDARFYPNLYFSTMAEVSPHLCNKGDYKNALGVCTKCSDTCETCFKTATNCTSCIEGKFNYEGTCLNTCPYNSYVIPEGKVCIPDTNLCPNGLILSFYNNLRVLELKYRTKKLCLLLQ